MFKKTKKSEPSAAPNDRLPIFHYFSKLPPELRYQIWDQVEIEPRIVKLRLGRRLKWIRCLTKAPAILHACRESRNRVIYTQRYQRAFALSAFSTWINFDVDKISVKPMVSSWIEVDKSLISRFYNESKPNLDFFCFTSIWVWGDYNLREPYIVSVNHGNGMTCVGLKESKKLPKADMSFRIQWEMDTEPEPDCGCLSYFLRRSRRSPAMGPR